MQMVTINEIQQNLASYLHQVEAGETLIAIEAGKPVAEIRPIQANIKQLRPFALCAGEFTVPDDFDDPFELKYNHITIKKKY